MQTSRERVGDKVPLKMHHGVPKVSAEEVITKLKDDGDFDTLQSKIIHKLKENEELRSRIVASVKQSAAFSHPGSEIIRSRELSDTIYQEIGENVMSQISDCLWTIIKSEGGMKKEISETIEKVYKKLVDSREKKFGGGLPLQAHQQVNEKKAGGSARISPCRRDEYHGKLNEQPSLTLTSCHGGKVKAEMLKVSVRHPFLYAGPKKQPRWPHTNSGGSQDFGASYVAHNQGDVGSDEDPEVPPGFG